MGNRAVGFHLPGTDCRAHDIRRGCPIRAAAAVENMHVIRDPAASGMDPTFETAPMNPRPLLLPRERRHRTATAAPLRGYGRAHGNSGQRKGDSALFERIDWPLLGFWAGYLALFCAIAWMVLR